MAHPRKFRFGVQTHGDVDAAAWRAQARKMEDLGYSTLFMPDHFDDQLAPVPALMAAADATTTLRVGSLVLDSPAILVGTVDEMIETLERRRARWDMTNHVVPIEQMDAFAPVVAKLAGT